MALTACKKEIDFDFHEIAPVVVIEGRVTNEGSFVTITKSRSVTDSVRSRCLPGAVVAITDRDSTVVLSYDASSDRYHADMKGVAGHSYRLTVEFEGQHYESVATMPAAAPILSAGFYWMKMLDERMLVYELWATDPNPDERNYFWFRMDRRSTHPHFEGKNMTEPYRWNVHDDRGCPPGKLFLDMICTSEKVMDEDEEDNWKHILYEGDRITFQLMTVDQSVYNYFASLRAGQGGGANPKSNIVGGCSGYFAAGTVTRSDTIVFHRSHVQEWTPVVYSAGLVDL